MSEPTKHDLAIRYELQICFSPDEVNYIDTHEEPREKYLKLFTKAKSSLQNIKINIGKIPYSIIRFYLLGFCKIHTKKKEVIYILRSNFKRSDILNLGNSLYKVYNGLLEIDEFPYISEIEIKPDKLTLASLPNVDVPYSVFEVIGALIRIGEYFEADNSVLKNRYIKE
jgi:hypothetical protein